MALEYGNFELHLGRIVIDDIAYDWIPGGFQRDVEEFGVRTVTKKSISLTNVIITPDPTKQVTWNAAGEDLFTTPRKLITQAIQIAWQGSTFMNMCMADHLNTLYTLQRRFWIQFDDEMSYDGVGLEPKNPDYKDYLFPTFPIGYYREIDTSDPNYLDRSCYLVIYKDGDILDWESNPWRIDPDSGLVSFVNGFTESDAISAKYVWRMYGRIVAVNLAAVDIAQNTYAGELMFEQLLPPHGITPWESLIRVADCRGHVDALVPGGDDDGGFDPPIVSLCLPYVTSTVDSTSMNRSGATDVWTGLSAVKVLDGSYATSGPLTIAEKTYILDSTTFIPPTQIPSAAKISRIRAVISHISNPATGIGLYDDLAQLTLNGVPIGSNMAQFAIVPLVENERSYVFDNVAGLTASDINDGGLGFQLGYRAQLHNSSTDWTLDIGPTSPKFYSGGDGHYVTEFTLVVTWIGAGPSPETVLVSTNSLGSGGGRGKLVPGGGGIRYATSYTGSAAVDNGFGHTDEGPIGAPGTIESPSERAVTSMDVTRIDTPEGVGTQTITMESTVSVEPSDTQESYATHSIEGYPITSDPSYIYVNLVKLSVCYEGAGGDLEIECADLETTSSDTDLPVLGDLGDVE